MASAGEINFQDCPSRRRFAGVSGVSSAALPTPSRGSRPIRPWPDNAPADEIFSIVHNSKLNLHFASIGSVSPRPFASNQGCGLPLGVPIQPGENHDRLSCSPRRKTRRPVHRNAGSSDFNPAHQPLSWRSLRVNHRITLAQTRGKGPSGALRRPMGRALSLARHL